MIVTTTPSIEGRKISTYLGIVTGEAIMGANIFKDLMATIRDVVGGRSAAYEEELIRAKTLAMSEMMDRARALLDEARRELEQAGHRFYSRCDTETVLHAFLEWDIDAFTRFRGMFAAAFWTQSEKRLVLVRDHMGIKPLYFARRRENLGSDRRRILQLDRGS